LKNDRAPSGAGEAGVLSSSEAAMPPDSHPHTAVSNRIDLLRGGFALWVFLAHSYDLFLILRAGQTTAAPITWFDTLLRSGHFGVTGFFFLSGFCIHWSISKSLAKHPGFDWKKYFKARFWRIAPLFYCGLLLAVVLEFVILTWLNRVEVWPMPGEKLRNLAGALFFLQGFNGGYGSYAPSWSITYEIIYYIAWPVVLWWAGFRANKAVLLSLGIAFGSMALFYGLWKWKPVFGDAIHIVLWQIPLASLMWILGAWCRQNFGAILSHKIFPALSRWWWVFVLGWIAASTTLSFLNVSLLGRVVLNPFVWVGVPLMVLADWRISLKPSGVAWFADLSYPLYLMHGPLLVFLVSLLRTTFPSAPAWMTVLISGLVTLMIAATAGVKIERFFLALRKRQAT